MTSGYWGELLHVDLTSGEIWREKLSDEWARRYVGGVGFGARLLWDQTAAGTDPLGPENLLIFGVGPFQGHPLPGSGKWSVIAKSPLTGTYGEANGGGDWGPKFRRCGYDGLVIHGQSERPVYLWVSDREVELRDAPEFWGMDTWTVVPALQRAAGAPQASVAAIGPAGERLVKIACIAADGHGFAGRCGLGAVMGAKRLKAVVVDGRKTPPAADPKLVARKAKELFKQIYEETGRNEFRLHGTAGLMTVAEGYGDVPIKYWRGDVWTEGAEKIGCPNMTEVLNISPWGCLYCPIQCHRRIGVPDRDGKPFTGPGPEYETLGMFGATCLIDDVHAIARANELANRLGIDTISAGAMVGFAMESWERGWLSASDTGGIQFTWGNGEALVEMVRQIALKEGFGALFADGTLAAAERIGPQARDIVVHVRGLDLPAHDPRACISLAPTYATGTRGACHIRGFPEDAEMGAFLAPEVGIPERPKFFVPDDKAQLAVTTQNLACMFNSLVICMFQADGGGMSVTEHLNVLNAVTGWGWSLDEFMEAGERIFTLQRLINIRDGLGPEHDRLPARMFEPAREGARKGQVPPAARLLRELYELRGWDAAGYPTPETLARLGL